MRFRLISSRWARCLKDFHGEIRIIGITKEKNKLDLRVMDLVRRTRDENRREKSSRSFL
jgi:hypothetical protein